MKVYCLHLTYLLMENRLVVLWRKEGRILVSFILISLTTCSVVVCKEDERNKSSLTHIDFCSQVTGYQGICPPDESKPVCNPSLTLIRWAIWGIYTLKSEKLLHWVILPFQSWIKSINWFLTPGGFRPRGLWYSVTSFKFSLSLCTSFRAGRGYSYVI